MLNLVTFGNPENRPPEKLEMNANPYQNLYQNASAKFSFLTTHQAFRDHPITVIARILLWQALKIVRWNPTIQIHRASRMKLFPGKRIGIHGYIYIFRDGFEPAVRCAIDRYVSPGMKCYDIGANIGLWTLRLQEIVEQSGKVYAFEPLSKNLAVLKSNLELSQVSNTEIVPTAIGAHEGEVTLYTPSHDPGSSSIAPGTPNDAAEQIKIQRLDRIWESQGCPQIGFVKIDIEGYEPFALEGGEKFFSNVQPIVCCEINPPKLSQSGLKPTSIFKRFQSWGYEGFRWDITVQDLVEYNLDQETEDGFDMVFIPAHR
ncbi:MAG: FkbM family methyltransferase [Myxacorys chilensis ATA2-1-KO14]|jgi:FkbM family methyltransferase|nr:FkbM family methyltransferase [Myxacorys chilensis ATA2-1-KO14]